MTRFIRLSRGGMIEIPSAESCPECGETGSWVHSHTPEGEKPLAITGDPEGATYYCRFCGTEWPVLLQ